MPWQRLCRGRQEVCTHNMTMANEDRQLILRIKRRDESALGAMMNKYSSQVFSVAFRVLRQWPDAQEVTQDVFHALWRSPEKFDSSKGPLLSWLLILSRSRALDLLRRIVAKSSRQAELTPNISRASANSTQSFNVDREILIEELLQRLPPEQGNILEKIYIEGYALSEFAAGAGIPLGTIKNRVRFSLKKLRSEFA